VASALRFGLKCRILPCAPLAVHPALGRLCELVEPLERIFTPRTGEQGQDFSAGGTNSAFEFLKLRLSGGSELDLDAPPVLLGWLSNR